MKKFWLIYSLTFIQTHVPKYLPTDLFDVALELLVSNRQRGEELLQSDSSAMLTGMWHTLSETTIVVIHQPSSDLSTLMAGHNTKITAIK